MPIRKIYAFSHRFTWLALLALLPVTSMPLVVRLVGSDAVAAPSGILLLGLVLVWLIPYLGRGGSIPRQAIPLLFFTLTAGIATAAAGFLPLPAYKNFSLLSNQFKAGMTLGVGVCFYLVAATYPKSEKELQTTLKVINWSGAVVLGWALVQAGTWYTTQRFPYWIKTIHEQFSAGPLIRQRVSAFAFEPSWLAHQLNLLYLPLWLAASMRGFSAHRLRLWKFSFENLLLLVGLVILFLTLSRVGMIAFFLVLLFIMPRGNLAISRWIRRRVFRERLPVALIFVLLVLFYILLMAGLAYTLSVFDPRMSDLFNFTLGEENPLLKYADNLNFASRMVYWQAGWEVFADFPFLGVGLGGAGFFIPDRLGGYALGLMEVRQILYRQDMLFNIKSLWVRLLAETGVVGFSVFLTWMFTALQTARGLEKRPSQLAGLLGLASTFTIIAYLCEGFSVDTFALPYLWVMLGLAAATSCLKDNLSV